MIEVGEADFDLGACWAALQARVGPAAGAVAGFAGCVRSANDSAAGGSRVGEPVRALVLEHYPGMTEASIRTIVDEALARWTLLGVHIVHRVGRLLPGAQIVMVLVASGHRAESFAACEFIMDYLKTDAVFWKREEYVGAKAAADSGGAGTMAEGDAGGRWLRSAELDRRRRAGWVDD